MGKEKTLIVDIEAMPSENNLAKASDIIKIINPEKDRKDEKLKIYANLRKFVPPFAE